MFVTEVFQIERRVQILVLLVGLLDGEPEVVNVRAELGPGPPSSHHVEAPSM